jgi:alpha-L-arabinofuranosidase
MGLEENADEVIMAAYAPLFGHVDGCQWKPDLIYFDNRRSMGTISYYVQQMFSLNRGDRQLPLRLQLAPKDPKPAEEIPADMIGVGTWATQAEYKDIVVVTPDGQRHAVDLSGDSPLQDWQTQGGRWQVADGVLRQTSRAMDCRAWFKGAKWKDYTLRLKARKTAGDEGFLIMFRVRGTDDYAWANLGGWGNTADAIEQAAGGHKLQAGRRPGTIESGRWYDIELDVRGHRATCRVDGQTRLQADLKEVQGAEPQDLYATACADEEAGEILVRVVNFTGEPKRARLSIAGAGSKIQKATAITLAADDIEAFQSLDAPTRYSPAHAVLPDFAKNNEHVFAPYSFTVLRLKPDALQLKDVEQPIRGER